ncbi:MAG: hypothetical protein IIB68_12455 [Proteobacteria bacterium]|nr:hypothetical protein [Pseudomonadota bacterium]
MRIKSSFSGLAAAFLVVALGMPLTASADPRSTYQTADFERLSDGGVVGSAGTLIRSRKAVDANLALSGLDADSAYTIWFVIWNDPSECATNPCDSVDVGVPGNTIFYAAGFVTDDSGTANLSVHLRSGKLPDGLQVLRPGNLRKNNGFDAEIHMIVRTHGPILPGLVGEQISMVVGACNPTCADQIGIMFLPTGKGNDSDSDSD